MGCYGIGITRLPAAAIEQNHDERGIIWPDATRAVHGGAVPDRHGPQRRTSRPPPRRVYDELAGRMASTCMLDDRGERPGAMFADWELIGVPHRVVIIGDKRRQGRPVLEYQHRRESAAATKVSSSRGRCLLLKGRA